MIMLSYEDRIRFAAWLEQEADTAEMLYRQAESEGERNTFYILQRKQEVDLFRATSQIIKN